MAMTCLALPVRNAGAAGPGSFLRVHGRIADGSRTLDMASLEALPPSKFTTTTPWHPVPVEFSGVLVRDFLSAMGATGDRLVVTALNDYLAEIEIALLVENGALLATRQNSEPMAISDKGPVFLLFPFDSQKALQHQVFYSRSVWQICDIEVQ
ncbi:hypothetical protein [Aureimonas sp. AU12]|uniref:hypothetical protein n=1 Tax=Aureimonas sp. AU12 TaxID=1638161 RepID=UPI000782FE4B|nr:hypothetical protein [Aureimonas sp. AU12]